MGRETQKKEEIAFIVAGGSSVREILADKKLHAAIESYDCFGCNRAVEFFNCKYLVIKDLQNFVNGKNASIIDNFTGSGGIYAPLTSAHYEANKPVNRVKVIKEIQFSLENGLYTGGNAGVMALSLAIAKGYKRIALLGVDCCGEGKDLRFHGGYDHGVNPKNIDSALEVFATMFEAVGEYVTNNMPDVKIWNCSPISLVDIDEKYFERIDVRELLEDERFIRKRAQEVPDALQACT